MKTKFVDTPIFIKWMSAKKNKLSLEAAISGYILTKIMKGEKAITTTLVKDKVIIWFSRYKASALPKFIQSIRALVNLEIISPTLNDQEEACNNYGKYQLGISDLINLAVMHRKNINEIYTTDKGYSSANIKITFHELSKEPNFKTFVKNLKNKGFKPSFPLNHQT